MKGRQCIIFFPVALPSVSDLWQLTQTEVFTEGSKLLDQMLWESLSVWGFSKGNCAEGAGDRHHLNLMGAYSIYIFIYKLECESVCVCVWQKQAAYVLWEVSSLSGYEGFGGSPAGSCSRQSLYLLSSLAIHMFTHGQRALWKVCVSRKTTLQKPFSGLLSKDLFIPYGNPTMRSEENLRFSFFLVFKRLY